MKQKGHIFCVFVILVFLLSVSTITKATESKDGFKRCEHIVKQWASSSLDLEVKDDKHVLRNLLFFLHVPRTGGRTYFHCFLKKLYTSSLECPRSYDKLRFDPRKPKCRLLVTHDDYSMMNKLPKDETSVVTILRNPIDRVFSAYEFSVEVAARFLVHPNLTSATKMSGRLRSKNTISTLDIWPWKYLVPWMREDLFARRDARKQNGNSVVTSTNPYDAEEIVMPLHEYINNPIARDILHNGATFQVAGLTNNSYLTEAHDVRHCVLKYQSLGDYVLKVAKKRLDDMLYVGLTENHKESATMFANVVGTQAISQFTGSTSHGYHTAKNSSEQGSSMLESDFDTTYHHSNSSYQKPNQISSAERGEATKENMTAGKLMDVYESCISNLRKIQSERRVNSLKKIDPANFTKEARRQVSEALLQEITSLNHLDVELYKYAQTIFANQHKRMLLNKVVTKMTMVEHGGYMDGIPTGPIVDDDFDDILNFLDMPMECLEEDGLGGVEWDASESKFLGPIPIDALMDFPPVPQGNIGNGRVNAVAKSHPPMKLTEVQGTGTFQTQSPVSVLEGSNSCSGGKSISIKHDIVIPARPRSKRTRPSAVNPWVLMAPISSPRVASKKISDARKGKEKKRRLSLLSGAKESMKNYVQQINDNTVLQINKSQQPSFVKKCTHCEVTKTPQWREGPLGPKTLCNACGVRYRSGRLFPEYRPAASPTFVPSVHSNSHRKVVEMRKKSLYGAAEVEEPHKVIMGRKKEALPEPTIVADPLMSPAPEFVPMSSYLFDVY